MAKKQKITVKQLRKELGKTTKHLKDATNALAIAAYYLDDLRGNLCEQQDYVFRKARGKKASKKKSKKK